MRGNQLAGAAPRSPPPPRSPAFPFNFFSPPPPPRQQVIYLFEGKANAPAHLLRSPRGAEAEDPGPGPRPDPPGCRWQEEPPPRTEGQLWLIDFWCQELGPEAVRQHINCDPIIS